jgi:tryptophanyl-tRNA synthetase
MSKSYDNTIPLFASRAQLQKLIASLKTDSRLPHEPKETEGSALFQIYQAFASAEETQTLRQRYAQGIAWSEAKQLLLERIDQEIAPMRARYQHLIDHPQEVEALLLEGAQKARASATPFMHQLRHAVGLRPLPTGAGPAQAKASKTALASFKQYREADGKFYFKLVHASGAVLLQSLAFDAPKLAGQTIASLVQDPAALDAALPLLEALSAQQRATAEEALHALRQANAAAA